MTYPVSSDQGRRLCAYDHTTAHDLAERLTNTGSENWFHEVDGKPCTRHVCYNCQGIDPGTCPGNPQRTECSVPNVCDEDGPCDRHEREQAAVDGETLDRPADWTLPGGIAAALGDAADRVRSLRDHLKAQGGHEYQGATASFHLVDALAAAAAEAEQARDREAQAVAWEEQYEDIHAALRTAVPTGQDAPGAGITVDEKHVGDFFATITAVATRVAASKQQTLRYMCRSAADRADRLAHDYADLLAEFHGEHLGGRNLAERRAYWLEFFKAYNHGGGGLLDLDELTDPDNADEEEVHDLLDRLANHAATDQTQFILKAGEQLGRARAEVEDARREREDGYRVRALLLAALSLYVPAALTDHTPEEFKDEEGWQALYLYLAGMQTSWHIHPQDAPLFAHVENVPAEARAVQWDGHDTAEKYRRMRWFLGAPETAATGYVTGIPEADTAFLEGIYNGIPVVTIEEGAYMVALGHHDKHKAREAFNAYCKDRMGREVNFLNAPNAKVEDHIEHVYGLFEEADGSGPLDDGRGWDINLDPAGSEEGLVPLTIAEVC